MRTACVLLLAAACVASVSAVEIDRLRHRTRTSAQAGCGPGLAECMLLPPNRNAGLAATSTQQDLVGPFGAPTTPVSPICTYISVKNKVKIVTIPVADGRFTIAGAKPFVEAVDRALKAMKASKDKDVQRAYAEVRSASGTECCKCASSNGKDCNKGEWNLSCWGMAVDFYFGANAGPATGPGKTQRGLALMAPFLRREQLYWSGDSPREDAGATLRFVPARELLQTWLRIGSAKA